MRVLTINTDASLFQDSGAGGYGIWIVYAGYRYKKWGAFNSKTKDPQEAELKALLNALYISKTILSGYKVDKVVVNCDNSLVRDFVNEDFHKVNRKYRKLYEQVRGYLDVYPRCSAPFLQGKTGSSEGARYFVTNWCDKMAKEGAILFKEKYKRNIHGE